MVLRARAAGAAGLGSGLLVPALHTSGARVPVSRAGAGFSHALLGQAQSRRSAGWSCPLSQGRAVLPAPTELWVPSPL